MSPPCSSVCTGPLSFFFFFFLSFFLSSTTRKLCFDFLGVKEPGKKLFSKRKEKRKLFFCLPPSSAAVFQPICWKVLLLPPKKKKKGPNSQFCSDRFPPCLSPFVCVTLPHAIYYYKEEKKSRHGRSVDDMGLKSQKFYALLDFYLTSQIFFEGAGKGGRILIVGKG